MSRVRSTIAAAALVAAAVVASPLTTPTAAVAASACERGEGVWVVVDPGTLGGSATIACAPGDPSSGTAALTAAGFSWEFVKSFPGLICRIGGKPSKDQQSCENAPPGDAHWAYWYADAGGAWSYSRTGAAQRNPQPGQVEGWAFGTGSAPSVAPPAPPPEPEPEPEPEPAPEPGSNGPPSAGSPSGSSGSSGGASAGSGGSGSASSSGGSSSPSSSEGADEPSESPAGTAGSADAGTDDAAGEEDASPEGDGVSTDEGGQDPADDGFVRSVDRLAEELLGEEAEVDTEELARPVGEVAPSLRASEPRASSDEVAMDELPASRSSPTGLLTAGGLLAALAALGVVLRRRHVGT